MNIVTTCIGELPEELREAAINEQRERRKNGNIYYPFLSDECVESLKNEVMLTIWPKENGFIFTMDDCHELSKCQIQNAHYRQKGLNGIWSTCDLGQKR